MIDKEEFIVIHTLHKRGYSIRAIDLATLNRTQKKYYVKISESGENNEKK